MGQKRKSGRPPLVKLTLFPEVFSDTVKMSDDQFGKLMRAVGAFRFNGEIYSGDDLAIDIAFRTITGQIVRFDTVCETNRKNASSEEKDDLTEISEMQGKSAEISEMQGKSPPSPNPIPIPDPSPNSSKDNTADKPPKPLRHKYGEYQNVLLSDEEFAKLQAEIPCWQEMIERLSSYMESSGRKYKNHLATMRNWYRKDQSTASGKNPMPDYGGEENWSL